MTPEGHRIVYEELAKDARTRNVNVRPQPKPGEDIRDVEMFGGGASRESILEVLGRAGLMRMSLDEHPSPDAPRFAWTGTASLQRDRRQITHIFRDIKAA